MPAQPVMHQGTLSREGFVFQLYFFLFFLIAVLHTFTFTALLKVISHIFFTVRHNHHYNDVHHGGFTRKGVLGTPSCRNVSVFSVLLSPFVVTTPTTLHPTDRLQVRNEGERVSGATSGGRIIPNLLVRVFVLFVVKVVCHAGVVHMSNTSHVSHVV